VWPEHFVEHPVGMWRRFFVTIVISRLALRYCDNPRQQECVGKKAGQSCVLSGEGGDEVLGVCRVSTKDFAEELKGARIKRRRDDTILTMAQQIAA
jgi:hypothetical protein